MRTFKENSNIIKLFMARGPEHFYLPYYLDGDEFIKQIHVPNKEVRAMNDLTSECLAKTFTKLKGLKDLENLENEFGIDVAENFCINFTLTGLLDIKKHEPTEKELKLYQYIADIIVGQPNIMFKMVANTVENDELDDETIEEAEFNVYHAILELIMNIDRQAKFADETEVC